MNSDQKKKLKEVVESKIREYHQEIRELEELTKPIPLDASIGRISRMDAINNKSINEASLREKRKLLQRLEKVLDTIDNKNFGKCHKCGNEIPFGRLEYMPHVSRCIHCAG